MEALIVSIVVIGFSIQSYLSYKSAQNYQQHIAKLELLIKAENLTDYNFAIKEEPTRTTLEDSLPDSLQDIFDNMTPEEIRESFKPKRISNV